VRVTGSASATVLPSPSLTFEEVAVGDADGEPMMMVDRFEVTIELMPLLQGEFRVVSMRLDRPHMRMVVGEDGRLDWQARNEASKALDPDKVIIENLEIADGHIDYIDQAGETSLSFDGINAAIEARSLFGPWRIEGSYLDEGVAVPFRFATGRRLDDGTIRVKADLSPAGWPVSVAADGVVGSGEDGVFYDGTYSVTEIVPAIAPTAGEDVGEAGDTAGWRSEGTFRLTRDELAITQAVLTAGPPERPYSIAGSLSVALGASPSFEARASARQIDLDRSLGSGPSQPVEVAAAVDSLVGWLTNSFVPTIPGGIFFSVPGIVVGGAVVQDVAFEARSTIGGWRLASFDASLPGHSSLSASGVLATDHEVGFAGDVRLAVNQPTIFANWWRGRSEEGAGRLLAPFQVSGRTEIAPGRFAFDNIDALIGEAAILGRFAWSTAEIREHRRVLEAELVADTVDFTQLKALAELIAGKDLANSGALADSYDVKLSADTLQFEDVTMREVAIDASLADDTLSVSEFGVGDIGGASLNVTQGRIASLTGKPQGHLDAQLEAETLRGLTRIVERLLPESLFAQWLRRADPSLTPAFMTVSIEAPPAEPNTDLRVTVHASVASTTASAIFDLSGSLADWRHGRADVNIVVESPDAAEVVRQAGLTSAGPGHAGSGSIQIVASGVPAEGLDTRISGEFAGVGLRSNGRLTLAAGAPPSFAGSLAAAADDLEPAMRLAGLGIPGAALGTPARIEATVEARGESADLAFNNSEIADRLVSGRMSLARSGQGTWQVGGDFHVDAVDVGWLTALGLGFAIEATDDPAAPWSKAPFGEPGLGPVTGRIAVAADELAIAPGFDATAAKMAINLQPNRIDVDLAGSQIVGGSLSGGLSIHNVGGNANVSGRVTLTDAALESLVWRRAGRAVGTGTLDLSADFEAAGRSPTALISSLTGGGTIAIRDGEARYVNPQAARLVIRAADLGQEFTEEALLDAFTRQIDGGSLTFEAAEGAFSIAAGVARLKSLAIDSEGTRAVGDALIDLNDFTIDSDWTVSFEPGDDKVQAATPQVGIVFRGALDDPARIIDVLQFGSYLNIRQEERLLEILSQAESDRLEKDRFNRERRKLAEDADRREREAVEAQRRWLEVMNAARGSAAEAADDAADDEAARVVAELERQRLAAEEAARLAAEEEEAARLAAEEAERQRFAAEEAARRAAEEEASRLAAEAAEQQRLASEEDAARSEAGTLAARTAEAVREQDLMRARDQNARSARAIAAIAGSNAANAAGLSTNSIAPPSSNPGSGTLGPRSQLAPPPTQLVPTPRPKPLLLTPPRELTDPMVLVPQ
jgi:uncharacterized protein involved in outer membrane biogenesis